MLGALPSEAPYFIDDLAVDQRQPLIRLLEANGDEIDALIISDDSRDRSAGLYLLEYHGDINRLASLSAWLDDQAAAIPGAIRGAALQPQFFKSERSIGEQLANIYYNFLGLSLETAQAFTERFHNIEDFDVFAGPWVARLRHARGKEQFGLPLAQDESLAAVKAKVLALPPEVAVFVVLEAGSLGGFSNDETRQFLRTMPLADRTELSAGHDFGPPDPCYAGEGGDRIRKRALEILAESPE